MSDGKGPGVKIQFESLRNFRDVGGLPVRDSMIVRRGVLYRSGTLADCSDRDLDLLDGLALKTVIDLRSDYSFEKSPDRLPPTAGLSLLRVPLVNDEMISLIPDLQALGGDPSYRGDGSELMEAIYRTFPINFAGELRRFLETISDSASHPVLCHCTHGKDRTGFFVAFLLSLVGVSREHVHRDYLLSNQACTSRGSDLTRLYGLAPNLALSVAEARSSYLEAAFATLGESHGGIEAYSTLALGITPEDGERLRRALLESAPGQS
jgi:protein-tyrosine phosphatase